MKAPTLGIEEDRLDHLDRHDLVLQRKRRDETLALACEPAGKQRQRDEMTERWAEGGRGDDAEHRYRRRRFRIRDELSPGAQTCRAVLRDETDEALPAAVTQAGPYQGHTADEVLARAR